MPVKSICRLLFLFAACGAAQGQQPARGKDEVLGMWVAMTSAMVQSCVQVDELLRKTCARAGTLPQPEKNGKLCELPALTFEARTARPYAEFKESWRAELKANEGEETKAVAEMRARFERDYAHMRTRGFTMTELYSLSREAKGCVDIEQRMLAPMRQKK